MATLKAEFRSAVWVLYRNRFYAAWMFGLIILFALIGFVEPRYFETEQQMFAQNIKDLTVGKGFFELAIVIMLNNLQASFLGIFLGLVFGVMPMFMAAVNGYFLGAVMSKTWDKLGPDTFLLVAPHGVFELPALAIAFGLGLRFGLWFREPRKWQDIKANFNDFMGVFFYIITPLIVTAALIESTLILFF